MNIYLENKYFGEQVYIIYDIKTLIKIILKLYFPFFIIGIVVLIL